MLTSAWPANHQFNDSGFWGQYKLHIFDIPKSSLWGSAFIKLLNNNLQVTKITRARSSIIFAIEYANLHSVAKSNTNVTATVGRVYNVNAWYWDTVSTRVSNKLPNQYKKYNTTLFMVFNVTHYLQRVPLMPTSLEMSCPLIVNMSHFLKWITSYGMTFTIAHRVTWHDSLCLSMQEEESIEHITAKCHMVTLGNGQHVDHWCNLGIGLIIE